MFVILLLAATIICGVAGQLLLKNGMKEIGRVENIESLLNLGTFAKMASNVFVALGIIFYAMSAIAWLGAISQLDISLAYPLISLSYVIVALLAWAVFKENISLVRWAGILVILFGSFLLAKSA